MTREEVFTILRVESEARQKQTRNLQIFFGAMVILSIVLTLVAVLRHKGDMSDFMYLGGLIPLIGISAGMTPKNKDAVLEATAMGDPEVTKYLIDSLDSGDTTLIKLVKPALAQMLPKLPEAILSSLEPRHILLLRQSLTNQDVILAPSAAKALAALGDRDSIAVMETLRDSESTKKPLRDAVTHSLPDLRIKLAKTVIDQRTEELKQLS